MEPRCPPISLSDLGPKDHVCFLFDSEEDHRAVVGEFVRLGAERGEKLIYVRDARSEITIRDYLKKTGVDVEKCLAAGQLEITDFVRAYMYGSVFDPERMIRLVGNETEIALAQGWSGLRLTIEMTWVLSRRPGSERVVQYESISNRFYRRSRCLAMCQYDRRYLKPELLLNALSTHPVVAWGERVYENPFYRIPPPAIGKIPAAQILNHWLSDLAALSGTALA